jgi:hypothetical protein
MNTRSPIWAVVVGVLVSAMAFPPSEMAQTTAPEHAGEVARLIPTVGITRGSQQLPAALQTPVDWGDIVTTQPDGRARIGLDDGSMINVGADTTMQVTQHSTAQQQTQIDLTYGRMRANVVKFTRPNANFQVHTPVGVAGVVGADVYFFFENDVFSVIDFEGLVHFCNAAGACVDLVAGQIAMIRGNNAPDAGSQATPEEVNDAVASTAVDYQAGNPPPPARHFSTGEVFGLTMLVVIPLVVVSITLRGKPAPLPGCPVGTGTTAPPPGC